jgi:ketosteroid isomerase-like protein
MKTDNKIESEIKKLTKAMLTAYENKDLECYLKFYAKDPSLVILGSGPDEKRLGYASLKKQIQRDFSQAGKIKTSVDWINISSLGDAAWSFWELNLKVSLPNEKKPVTISGRMTTVYIRQKGEWKIIQGHFSVPDKTQEKGRSYPGK